MISRELARKIRYIRIYTSKAVSDALAGEYQSAFKGSGMEFNEVREYQPGDEVRSIDWNVTARQGRPYVKRFNEERELTVMFIVDMSASGMLGTCGQGKRELAAELCALLAFSAVKSNDKAGLIMFSDRIEGFIPPAKGVGHAMRIVRSVMGHEPSGRGTDLAGALAFFGKVMHRRCVAFLLSDFQCDGYARQLGILGRKHDIIALDISDPREHEMPDAGLVLLEDSETGELAMLDTSSRAARNAYAAKSLERKMLLKQMLRSMKVDSLEVETGRDYVADLARLFRSRACRR